MNELIVALCLALVVSVSVNVFAIWKWRAFQFLMTHGWKAKFESNWDGRELVFMDADDKFAERKTKRWDLRDAVSRQKLLNKYKDLDVPLPKETPPARAEAAGAWLQ
jgi:hypothetical protein